ncbi:hypothetical protein [Prosthecochloris sp. HL-130-GSB]|jgi:hypothetical protein|uniref:hypothetical protein n=1 Tax=Prosthecochloris sp. HL-130-GSB TaxID=1974213 RepID=UPI000A1C0051|nr:hypothetical protein [Prosthecochloris sp. HL-130-GSB]ARM30624.1 hypothetical protein B9H02_03890 [Prosthecochloris sp. HL-130-GSB]
MEMNSKQQPMKDPLVKDLSFRNWIKALLLSPGTLFSAAYLVIYLLTNISLSGSIRNRISDSVSRATGENWQLSVQSLHAGAQLNTVTLKNIRITPTSSGQASAPEKLVPISIKELEVPCRRVFTIFFDNRQADISSEDISRRILVSMKHKGGSPKRSAH